MAAAYSVVFLATAAGPTVGMHLPFAVVSNIDCLHGLDL